MKRPIELGAQPHLQTSRLWLSPFVEADAPAVFSYASNPSVSRYTTWNTHRSIVDAERFIRMVQDYESEFCWAIRLSQDGPASGAIEFGLSDESTGSVHFVLAEQLWNQGLMTEAVASVVGWAFDSFAALERIVTAAASANVGSRRVLEKCRFRLTGLVHEKWDKFDEPVELAAYMLDREQ